MCVCVCVGGVIWDVSQRRESTNHETVAKSQQLVAQWLLACLQYYVPIESSTKDLLDQQ